jgi:hypothetical protein
VVIYQSVYFACRPIASELVCLFVLFAVELKKEEVTDCRRKLHNKELCDLYTSPIIVIKLWRIGWPEHVVRTGRRGMCIGYWWESQRGKDN